MFQLDDDAISRQIEVHVNDLPVIAEPEKLSVVGVEIVHPDKIPNQPASRDQPLKSLKNPVVEALFRSYFTDGRDISNRQTLIDVVAVAGLDRQAAEAMLNSDDGMAAILSGSEMSQQHGVTGVPFFIIDQSITLAGAQAPETFLDAFKQAST